MVDNEKELEGTVRGLCGFYLVGDKWSIQIIAPAWVTQAFADGLQNKDNRLVLTSYSPEGYLHIGWRDKSHHSVPLNQRCDCTKVSATSSEEQCGSYWGDFRKRCILPKGHGGPHGFDMAAGEVDA